MTGGGESGATRRRVGNPLALAVLACLGERPMHPYEIASTLRERHRDESIRLNYGALYAVVEALCRNRLIAAEERERAGNRPERTVYRLTEAGSLELTDWLAELLSIPVREYTSFGAGLALVPVLSPKEVVTLLEERCRRLDAALAQSKSVGEHRAKLDVPRLFLLDADYRARLLEAERDWVRGLLADIATGSLGGMSFWRGWHETGAQAGDQQAPIDDNVEK